jgi:hypothetical protein
VQDDPQLESLEQLPPPVVASETVPGLTSEDTAPPSAGTIDVPAEIEESLAEGSREPADVTEPDETPQAEELEDAVVPSVPELIISDGGDQVS